MWKGNLKDNYSSFEEFESYDSIYNLAERLEFASAEQAWEANPMFQGSSNPKDFKVIPEYCVIRKDLQKEGLGVPLQDATGKFDRYIYISGKAKRQYRWLGDTEGFQVKYRGQWYHAYSIDFDFL